MDQPTHLTRQTSGASVSFGPFCLHTDQHVLSRDGDAVQVGSRALDLLIALTDRGGDLVTKDELLARVWPNMTVEESNLRAQVALLRKVLGENQASSSYIAAVPGRGYRFVGSISRNGTTRGPEVVTAQSNFPRQLARPLGRDDAIKAIIGRFQRCRLTTILGPGGIGKTTLSLSVAEQLYSSYEDGICFLDLAPVTNANLLPDVLAAALQLQHGSPSALQAAMAHLRDRRMLLIFDSCELLVEAVAHLAEAILKHAPKIQILATSREALRAEDESVYRLAPLEMPPVTAGLTAADALAFPSVQLFVARAIASDSGFEFDDAEAPIVADICRQLDGIALAIELAAGRVEAFGTRGIAELLGDRFRLLSGGRRTALPRHQTLAAALDWSYEALTAPEQSVLRRLSVFVGDFTLEAVIAATGQAQDCELTDLLAKLVAKSLVVADANGKVARYRLLDTTRAYALAQLTRENELSATVRRVAHYICEVLERSHREVETLSAGDWVGRYGGYVNTVRMVLDWAYSAQGDPDVGLTVTIAAVPLWYQQSSVDECLSSADRALHRIADSSSRDEHARQLMKLYMALGLSQSLKFGFAPQSVAAFGKVMEIAEGLNDFDGQAEALWGLWRTRVGTGEYRVALELCHRFMALARSVHDRFIGDRMISMTLFAMGDCRGSRHYADRMLAHDTSTLEVGSSASVRFRFGQSALARIQPAQLLWIQGYPDQAVVAVSDALDAARASSHAISMCDALARWACPVEIHVGNHEAASVSIATLLEQSTQAALAPWEVIGRCWRGSLLIRQGHADRGTALLGAALEELQRGQLFTLYAVRFSAFLVEGLASLGSTDEAATLIKATVEHCEEKEELWCLAELLRIQGEILLKQGGVAEVVEPYFLKSIEWARQQDALSWELRSAMSLAGLYRKSGRLVEARQTLAGVYSQFTEGFATADLRAAACMIAELR